MSDQRAGWEAELGHLLEKLEVQVERTQELHFGQELNIEEEKPKPEQESIQIVSLYHNADANYMQRLTSHLNVMKRQLANENLHLNYESHEIWTDYFSDDAQEALGRATYLLILMSLEFLTAIYHDAQLYQALQQAIRNKGAVGENGATISIALMTTRVQWSRDEFPVSIFYPQPNDKALASIRDKDEVYVEIVEQIRQWITQE